MAEFIRIVENNKDEILGSLEDAIERALEAMGAQAENHVKMYETAVDTSNLKNSITHTLEGKDTVAIGTPVEYAPYVEYGTGIYAESGGRKTPWSYKDEEGNWHRTRGQKPIHFLRDGIMKHLNEYAKIAEQALKGF
jgi:hypothetical protein